MKIQDCTNIITELNGTEKLPIGRVGETDADVTTIDDINSYLTTEDGAVKTALAGKVDVATDTTITATDHEASVTIAEGVDYTCSDEGLTALVIDGTFSIKNPATIKFTTGASCEVTFSVACAFAGGEVPTFSDATNYMVAICDGVVVVTELTAFTPSTTTEE